MEREEALRHACDCESSCAGAESDGNTCSSSPAGNKARRPSAPIAAVVTSGMAVSACALCCAVPMVWPALAAAASSGLFAWFERSQRPLAAASLVVVAWAWIHLVRARRKRGLDIGLATAATMTAATAMSAVALFWSEIEPGLVRLIEGA